MPKSVTNKTSFTKPLALHSKIIQEIPTQKMLKISAKLPEQALFYQNSNNKKSQRPLFVRSYLIPGLVSVC